LRARLGGWHGSCHHRRKPMEAVIRGSNDLRSARVVSRLQTLGRRIFPGGKAGRKARGAGQGQLDAAVHGERRGPIRGG
jgi:hypothetical protein